MKYKWKVQPAPTGRYRSFEKRGWPTADYENGRVAASIECEDDYRPQNAKEGKHSLLTVRIADHSTKPFTWKKITKRFATLQEAKDAVDEIFKKYPEFLLKKEGE